MFDLTMRFLTVVQDTFGPIILGYTTQYIIQHNIYVQIDVTFQFETGIYPSNKF